MFIRLFSLALLLTATLGAQSYRPSTERAPMPAREFRGAWCAVVHNLDWPSSKGLSAGQQQAEMRAMLDRMAALNMNAILFQVRTQCDAVYASSREPWSPWLTGSMGVSPGYDPLAYCIQQAHARGIEVHAWFNPFRALCNASSGCGGNHVCLTSPGITRRYGSLVWCDPGAQETRSRALGAIMDVVRRYDVDGVHLDDYFYPYPEKGMTFQDGRSPATRREIVDDFVQELYSEVKGQKKWVRVGISPFGIWRPGVPSSIEAGLDAYEQLGCDARKWLSNGWVDYLAPQLYWRDQPAKQSFSTLLNWWRQQGSRPVWPGIATARIGSSEDPGRPASEIIRQIDLSRKIGRNWVGQIHWSAKSLMTNRGGINGMLQKGPYGQPALPPPMPWLSRGTPACPEINVAGGVGSVQVRLKRGDGNTSKYAIQGRFNNQWRMLKVVSGGSSSAILNMPTKQLPDAVAVSAVDRYGNLSAPVVWSH